MVDAYVVTFAALLLSSGALGNRIRGGALLLGRHAARSATESAVAPSYSAGTRRAEVEQLRPSRPRTFADH